MRASDYRPDPGDVYRKKKIIRIEMGGRYVICLVSERFVFT